MDLFDKLMELLPKDRVSRNETVLERHGRDESFHKPAKPDVVVFPINSGEVASIVKLAGEYNVPVVPFGIGSSLEGHVIPIKGGISMDFSLMNKVLEIRPQDFLVKVQPGITRTQLNKELKPYGLFFPVDPGADATIGGMTATNASGTMAVRYGTMRDQVRDIEVVLADGRIIRTGGLAAKSSSGYHLNGLFVGSEGTLGCFTEITLRVYGIPEHIATARAVFSNTKDAVDAVVMIRSGAIPVARCEFVDARSVRQVNEYHGLNYPEKPTLFLEFHGNEMGLKQDIEFTKEIVKGAGCEDIVFETDSKTAHQLWEIRHQLLYAFVHSCPGKSHLSTDVCLPVSELAGVMELARQTIDEIGLDGGVFGHVGDGNFHCLLMIDPDDETDIQKANQINATIVRYALKLGGTCTGEHGVGIGKRKYQQEEHGEAYEIMKAIKSLLDPNDILNPGKLL